MKTWEKLFTYGWVPVVVIGMIVIYLENGW